MKSLNLYQLTRVSDDLINPYIELLSQNLEDSLKPQEKESIYYLTEKLIEEGATLSMLDGFYLSYVIPQISKEFDILKLTKDATINIELKSEDVGNERMQKQLLQNRYYLKYLNKPIFSFTFVQSTKQWFTLKGDEFVESSFQEALSILEKYKDFDDVDINSLFKPINYLISPIADWDRFLNGEYFLTDEQNSTKRDMFKTLTDGFFGIGGEAGTGKTLMMFDIAKSLSALESCCLVLFNEFANKYQSMDDNLKIKNLQMITVESLLTKGDEYFSKFKYFVFDEMHLLDPQQLENILQKLRSNNITLIFSYLTSKVLQNNKVYKDVENRMQGINPIKIYTLNGSVRVNKDVYSFVNKLFDEKQRITEAKNVDYSYISLLCANSKEEAEKLIKYYKDKDYTFINYLPKEEDKNNYSDLIDCHILDVLNQEFNSVIVYMTSDFLYDDFGKLTIKQNDEDSDDNIYRFYKSITKAKNNLAIIVIDNPSLFSNLFSFISKKPL